MSHPTAEPSRTVRAINEPPGNDLNNQVDADSCVNALDTGTYWQEKASTHVQVIVSDPPIMVLDILLPIWQVIAKFFVCVRIPTTYMLQPPTPRAHFLQALDQEECLDVFPIYINNRRDPEYIWMVMYKHPAIRVALRSKTWKKMYIEKQIK
jgi:hypothetical protein